MPYGDFFALYGPAQFWVLGAIFSIFGPSVLAEPLVVVLTLAGLASCSYCLASRLSSPRWAVLTWTATLGVAIVGNDVAFYFLAERPSATRYHELHPGQVTTRAVQEEIIGELDWHEVRVVVLYDEEPSTEPNWSAVSSGVTLLDDYLRRRYRTAAEFGKYRIVTTD